LPEHFAELFTIEEHEIVVRRSYFDYPLRREIAPLIPPALLPTT
jgi:hypothetical protein